jgi:hypothetical protein
MAQRQETRVSTLPPLVVSVLMEVGVHPKRRVGRVLSSVMIVRQATGTSGKKWHRVKWHSQKRRDSLRLCHCPLSIVPVWHYQAKFVSRLYTARPG